MAEFPQIDLSKYSENVFGENVQIFANNFRIKKGVVIENDVYLESDTIEIGFQSKIEKNTKIKPLQKIINSKIIIGDNVFIGFNNQILVPHFEILDYSQLHNSGLHSGYKPLKIGYNCWIGQNSILNSTEELTIKNNVRIGTQSQIWTHVASGELLEGCTLFGNKAVTLEDDVWLVGGAVISPGLNLAKKSIIMTGSVLTKSTEEKHTYAGVPAKDVTEKLNFWNDVDLEFKTTKIKEFVLEFETNFPEYKNKIFVGSELNPLYNNLENLQILKNFDFNNSSICTIFNLENKMYSKKRSNIEISFIKFCLGYRARFIPFN